MTGSRTHNAAKAWIVQVFFGHNRASVLRLDIMNMKAACSGCASARGGSPNGEREVDDVSKSVSVSSVSRRN